LSCLTPRVSWILLLLLLPILIVVQQSLYISPRWLAIRSETALRCKQCLSTACGIVSKTLAFSTTVIPPPESALMQERAFPRKLMLALHPSRLVYPVCLSANLINCLSLLSNIPEYMRAKREPIVADITGVHSWLGNENRAFLSPQFRIIVYKQAGVHYSCKHGHCACLPEMCLLHSIRSGGNAGLYSSQLKNDFLLSYRSEHFQYSDIVRGITFTRNTQSGPVVPQSCSDISRI